MSKSEISKPISSNPLLPTSDIHQTQAPFDTPLLPPLPHPTTKTTDAGPASPQGSVTSTHLASVSPLSSLFTSCQQGAKTALSSLRLQTTKKGQEGQKSVKQNPNEATSPIDNSSIWHLDLERVNNAVSNVASTMSGWVIAERNISVGTGYLMYQCNINCGRETTIIVKFSRCHCSCNGTTVPGIIYKMDRKP